MAPPHSAYRALIEGDAENLIEHYGERAYSEARERRHDGVFSADRPEHHWEKVKEAIRRTRRNVKARRLDRSAAPLSLPRPLERHNLAGRAALKPRRDALADDLRD